MVTRIEAPCSCSDCAYRHGDQALTSEENELLVAKARVRELEARIAGVREYLADERPCDDPECMVDKCAITRIVLGLLVEPSPIPRGQRLVESDPSSW